jgi:hypothetical protein
MFVYSGMNSEKLRTKRRMFFLRQEWRDQEDGIETVVLHWVVSGNEQEPNWRRSQQAAVMMPQPATYPAVRTCVVWVTPPFSRTRMLSHDQDDSLSFLLHSFHEVVQRGRTWSTEVSRQEMRSAWVTHSDASGEFSQASLCYTLDDFTHVNYTPMFLEGASYRQQHWLLLPERQPSATTERAWLRRHQYASRLPAPHRFHGRVWGPHGARALYALYLSQGSYNPFTERGIWLLRDGNPWEISL